MDFVFLCAFDHKNHMEELYREYNELLVETDEQISDCLAMQNYDREIAELEKKFAPPLNSLVIAMCGDKAAGCAGIKYFAPGICELKRLYVREEYRKAGLGRALCELMLDHARQAGYEKMYLDTLPGLESAVRLYYRLGFYEIEKYYDNPVDKALYLCRELRDGG